MENLQSQPHQLIRKVRFPIKFKFILMLVLFLVATMTLFLFLATKLIREDKAAYIYDTILQRTEEKAVILEANLLKWQSLLTNSELQPKNYPEIAALYQQGQLVYKSETLASIELPAIVSGQGQQVFFSHNRSYLMLEKKDRSGALLIDLASSTNTDSPFEELIVEPSGRVLSKLSPRLEWLDEINQQTVLSGSLRLEGAIVGFVKLPQLNWILLSRIDESKAFAVAGYMVSKSFYFALLILGIAIIIGILAVRPLTSQLESLTQTTQRIGLGDFTQNVQAKSFDEIGVLSDSFNLMSKKILAYMEEMKEKARLENEMKVAQLVQTAFIPPKTIQLGDTEILSYTTPASECGGDWWGMLEYRDRQIFMIADATGHGVPAALLTATINACKESLVVLFERDPELAHSPARMMSYLNRVISRSGDQIQMTCFLASWHPASKTLTYSNASHPPALLYLQPKESVGSKENIRPLLEAKGPRLGEQEEVLFTENYVELPAGVSMVLYTDGILEAQSPEGQAWGQRRFINSLLSCLSQTGHPQLIIEDLAAFHQSSQYDDDLTLVHVRL